MGKRSFAKICRILRSKRHGRRLCYLPIEVKWTDAPDARDARHLNCFLNEYPTFGLGYVVCRVPRKIRLNERVMALPWQTFLDEIATVLSM